MPRFPGFRAAASALFVGLAAMLSAPVLADEPAPAASALIAGGAAVLPAATSPNFTRPLAAFDVMAFDPDRLARPGLLVDAERRFEPAGDLDPVQSRFLPPPAEHDGFVPGRDRGNLRTGFTWLSDVMNAR